MVVETPERGFIASDETIYTSQAVAAYYWIREVYRWAGTMGVSVWQNAACDRDNPKEDCPHCFKDCFHRLPAHPTGAPPT